ncbi:hypothetical protein BDV12DRAFT_202139 [Aspergillus spectabilis]
MASHASVQAFAAQMRDLDRLDAVGLEAGSYDVTQAPDISTLVITGKGGKVYWFLFGRMLRVYRGAAEIPRFTVLDAERFVGEHLHLPIRPHGTVTLAHVWKAQQQATLTALEEADFQHWAVSCVVCIGDSAHKMTPNSGQTDIKDALHVFEASMHARASSTIRSAADVTSLQALRGLKERILTRFILPHAGDYLSVPKRSLRGNTPFNPAPGIAHEPPLDWKRICLALPLLVAPFFFFFFLSSSPTHIAPTTSLSAETAPVLATWYAIALIESARCANEFNVLRFTLIWGSLVLYAAPQFLPVYYALHYILSPVGAFKSADMRTTDLAYTRSVFPVVLLVLGFPFFPTYPLSSGFDEREVMVPSWKILPLSIAVAQGIQARYILPLSTIRSDRLDNVRCDLATIRRTVGFLCVLAVVRRQYTFWVGGQSVIPEDGMGSSCLAMVIWIVLFMWDLKAAGMVNRSWGALGGCVFVVMMLGGEEALLGVAWLVREKVLATRRHRDALVEGC